MNIYWALTYALIACSTPAFAGEGSNYQWEGCRFTPQEVTYMELRAGAAKNGDVSAQYELGDFYLSKNVPEKALPYFEQSLQGRQAKGLPVGDTPQKIKRTKDMIAANLKKDVDAKARGQKPQPKPVVPEIQAVDPNPFR